MNNFLSTSGAVQRRSLRHLLVLCVVLLGSAFYAFGQDATLIGTVTDPSGSVVPNVTVTITNTETGLARNIKTDAAGQYLVSNLAIGHYTMKAEASGFKTAEKTGIVLNVADRVRQDFALAVGSTSESIAVEANAVAVQSDSSEVSSVITGQQVSQLATNGRSLYSLFALAPGASSIQGDFLNPTPVSGDSNVSINGGRPGHNLQILDGGENLDRGGSSGSVMPSIDAIAEFRNMTSNYSAEYGLSSAAMITTVIKSGTKQFHASLWEFNRNDAFDARNYFNPKPGKVSELRFNTYGFNAGGQLPFGKAHPTFFFGNMEWRSLVQGGSINQTVPLASEYPGASGAVFPTTNPLTGNPLTINVPSAANVAPSVLFANCPGGTAPAGVVQGSPFPGNTIPTCMISSNASALLAAGIFPKPTAASSKSAGVLTNFFGGNNSPTTVREEIGRVDHSFTDKFSVFGHWVSEQISQTYGTTQWSGDNVPTVADVFGNPAYSAVIHTTYVISPTLLNEASFNYNGNRIHIIPNGLVSAPSAFTFNRLFTGPNVQTRIPSIALSGGTGANYTSNWTPWNNKADDYQIRDDISWTKGAHQFKFGGNWAIYKKTQDAFANTQGNFTFNGRFTGDSFGDLLLGEAQFYNEDAVKISGQWNNISYAAYFQDNWRVTHRLTLNLGVRWDGVPHTYEANQLSSNFYPNLFNPANAAVFNTINGTICTAIVAGCASATPAAAFGPSTSPILAGIKLYNNGIGIGGKNGIPKGLVNSQWHNFGPRIGFAYDLTGQGKTVVRGGFGISYDRVQGNDMYNGATNPPGNLQPGINNVSLQNPGLDLVSGNTVSAATLASAPFPAGVTGIGTNYTLPQSYQYSLGVQQALGAKAVLAVSYVGSQGRHLNNYQEVNLPALSALPALVAAGGKGVNQQMSYLGYAGIRLSEDEANSHYNSLQVDVHGNVARDLQLQFGYTYSKAVDATTSNGSGGDLNNATNPYVGWKYDNGPSAFDRANIAFVNFVYQIPLLKNSSNRLLKTVAGGWEVSGIVTMESGAPLNMGMSGTNAASAIPNSGDRPNLSGTLSYPKTVAQWFNPAAFSAPACTLGGSGADCYGNLGHDVVRGPGRDNWNLSLFKSFVISESRGSRFEFRAESFNTWNHTQFKGDYNNGGISTNFGSGNFGAITAAFDPRVFQLGAKLIF